MLVLCTLLQTMAVTYCLLFNLTALSGDPISPSLLLLYQGEVHDLNLLLVRKKIMGLSCVLTSCYTKYIHANIL